MQPIDLTLQETHLKKLPIKEPALFNEEQQTNQHNSNNISELLSENKNTTLIIT